MPVLMTLAQAITSTYDALVRRQRAYWFIFKTPTGSEVLRDLAKFCRAFEPCWGSSPEETARYIGRNEVWHRIMQHMNLTPEELYDLYGGKYPLSTMTEEDHAE